MGRAWRHSDHRLGFICRVPGNRRCDIKPLLARYHRKQHVGIEASAKSKNPALTVCDYVES